MQRVTSAQFRPNRLVLALAVATLSGAATAVAQDFTNLPTIYVVGKEEGDIERQPGAVSIVSLDEMTIKQPRSTEEALRGVAGVAVKPEEESAIVANIGIRGLSSGDYKTLILEDGVPVAPGLFVGNGRYYNPRIQRMESIEVLKGAASLRYGPSTIGGVINYITKQPQDGVQVSLNGGSWNTREATIEVGGTSGSQEATVGAVITRVASDGFMDKDYDMTDVMLKAGLAVGDNQWVSVKYTDYESDANISYRGMFLGDYEAGERYNPAPDDYYLSGRRSVDLNHAWEISESAKLNTLIYSSQTWRDYWRFGVNGAESASQGRWVYTDNLNGNNRQFERFGIESRLQLNHELFGINSEAELGVRFMTEEMIDQTIGATRATPRTGAINKDVLDSAESLALYAQNRLLITEDLALTAGLRVESYEQERNDKRRTDEQNNRAETSNTEVMPGLGATYQLNSNLQVFASAYKAFSPALNGDALDGLQDQQLDAERSTNIEAGLRGKSGRYSYELTAFRMDFENQIIPANSNSDFQQTNGGETLHQGIEGALAIELGGGFSVSGNLTYIADAKYVGDRLDADDNIVTPDGNRVTYTPELTANVSLEYTRGNLRTALSLHHTDAQYTDSDNTTEIAENTSGFFTGEIESYTLLDLSAVYNVNDQLSFNTAVKNVTDESYIASLRQGIYVGPERSFNVGVRYRF